ncbi:branched chain amino acid aminotransferase [Actinoplanes ianthinogenes]|uniref:Branched chain amino acid aminotransferase n=1 Tax=Actinoplanes ianthinogenes TaxID=122358 RepID=A0ABM7M310_9ACTN|nr:aminotransferase class IV [Actinoplanes ianthinogenes]BCJ45984.1 branched chain amino acid aminotransferase [Actinoplanes ianthinogenes]GGR25514.1 branched chain amino acid aminotransferase [Actinoplanes ianthinogenes]
MSDRVMWFNGSCVPWEDARVHVWDELALRGANVFEGITAFWDAAEGRHRILAGDEHLDRLFQSAHLADIPAPTTRAEVFAALAEVAGQLGGSDVYLRPTFYAKRGRSTLSLDSEGAMYIGGFPYAPSAPPAVRAIVSSHRRHGGPIGAQAKSGGSYLDFRIFERERVAAGVEHVFILNDRDQVAEADGAAILLVEEDRVTTPSVDSGVLDSITKRIVLDLARDLGHRVEERPVLRGELHRAQVVLAGTLLGLRPVQSVDGRPVDDPGGAATAAALVDGYARLCRGDHPLAARYLVPLR